MRLHVIGTAQRGKRSLARLPEAGGRFSGRRGKHDGRRRAVFEGLFYQQGKYLYHGRRFSGAGTAGDNAKTPHNGGRRGYPLPVRAAAGLREHAFNPLFQQRRIDLAGDIRGALHDAAGKPRFILPVSIQVKAALSVEDKRPVFAGRPDNIARAKFLYPPFAVGKNDAARGIFVIVERLSTGHAQIEAYIAHPRFSADEGRGKREFAVIAASEAKHQPGEMPVERGKIRQMQQIVALFNGAAHRRPPPCR